MQDTIYLIVRHNKISRLTKTPPALSGYEVALKLNINVSDKFFERFIPETNISVPDEYVIEPEIQAKIVGMDKETLTELEKTIHIELEKKQDEITDDVDHKEVI